VTDSNTLKRSQLPLLGPYVEPCSPTERKVAEIWQRMLGMDCVGVTDSYEDLGGDSLRAASIFAEIETSFEIRLPWALLAEADTIEQLAAVIDNLQQRE
jgi:enterobactin synthetase component F